MRLSHGSSSRGVVFRSLTLVFFSLTTLIERSVSFSSNAAFGQTQRVVPKPKPPQKPVKAPVVDKAQAKTLEDETVTEFIRSEYEAWVGQHNKTANEERFKIFKSNFLATLETFETTGQYHALNQFADMTPEEYKREPSPVDEVDAYVRAEWNAWREQYNKPADESRYPIFKDNFLMTMKIFEETGKFNALNEHGDMTKEEFLRMQTKLAISSNKPPRDTGRYSNIPPMEQTQSYQRSEAMTFTPVTPRSSSDVLNNGGGGGDEYGMGSSGGYGNDWGRSGDYGGGRGGYGDQGRGGYGGNEWGMSSDPYGQAPSYAPPPMQAPAPYSRPSQATFTPVSPKSTSDVLNNKSSYGNDYGGGGGGGGSSSQWGAMGTGYSRETMAPMVGPPSSYQSSPPDPYSFSSGTPSSGYQQSAADYSRPSGATFTPITPQSTSDVMNNKGASSAGAYGGREWGFGPSPSPTPAPQPYTPQNPEGVTFTSISPNSSSDMRNRRQEAKSSSFASPSSSGKGTFSYVPKSPGSPNEAKNGINSFMGGSKGGNAPSNNKGNSNGKDNIWNKMASAVESLTGGNNNKPPGLYP